MPTQISIGSSFIASLSLKLFRVPTGTDEGSSESYHDGGAAQPDRQPRDKVEPRSATKVMDIATAQTAVMM